MTFFDRDWLEYKVERLARLIAADKMGLVKDKYGENLPDELWKQCIPEARRYLELWDKKLKTDFKKFFFETFPPQIGVDILRMIESGEINIATGRKLMRAYVSAHCRMLKTAKDFSNPKQTLQEEIDKQFEKFSSNS